MGQTFYFRVVIQDKGSDLESFSYNFQVTVEGETPKQEDKEKEPDEGKEDWQTTVINWDIAYSLAPSDWGWSSNWLDNSMCGDQDSVYLDVNGFSQVSSRDDCY
jgi:hypothetical protein